MCVAVCSGAQTLDMLVLKLRFFRGHSTAGLRHKPMSFRCFRLDSWNLRRCIFGAVCFPANCNFDDDDDDDDDDDGDGDGDHGDECPGDGDDGHDVDEEDADACSFPFHTDFFINVAYCDFPCFSACLVRRRFPCRMNKTARHFAASGVPSRMAALTLLL